MLAIIRDPYESFYAPLAVSIFVLLGFVRFHRYRRGKPYILLELLGVIAGISIVSGMLLPRPVCRIPLGHYEGKDQFEWWAQLRSEEKATRQEALIALCEILKQEPPNRRVRSIVESILAGADAREAMPHLDELRKSDDTELRQIAEHLIERLNSHPERGQ